MGLESLGDLVITSGVDASGLAAGLDNAVSEVKDAAQQMIAGLAGVPDAAGKAGDALGGLGAPAQKFSDAAQSIIDRQDRLESKAGSLRSALAELQAGYEAGTVSAGALTRAQEQLDAVMGKLDGSARTASEGTGELVGELLKMGGVVLTLEGLKEAVTEAFGAFATEQRAQESLAALTGSAEQAAGMVERLKEVAQDQALAFPQLLAAQQKMAAFGFSAGQSAALLEAAGNASRATGAAFDSIVASMERMAAAGMASGRQLAALGLTTEDLGNAMGVSADEASKLFKSLNEEARISVITEALSKFDGLAKETANDLMGQWQQLKNTAEFTFADIGKSLAPLGAQFVQFAAEDVKEIGGIIQGLLSMGKTFTEQGAVAAVALAGLAASAGLSAAAIGVALIQVGLAWRGMLDAEADAESAGEKASAGLSKVSITAHQTFADFPEFTAKLNTLDQEFAHGQISWQEYVKGVQQLNTQFFSLHPNLVQVTQEHKSFTQQVADLQTKLSGHLITQAQYDQQLQKLIQSYISVTKAAKDNAISLESILQNQAEANANAKAAQTILDELQKRYDAAAASGKGLADATANLAAAHQKLDPILKAGIATLSSWEQVEADLTKKQTDSTAAAKDASLAFLDLFQKYQAGIAPLDLVAAAYDNMNSKLKASGASLSDFGLKLPSTSDGIQTLTGHMGAVDTSTEHFGRTIGVTTTALSGQSKTMQDVINASQQGRKATEDFVDANSKLVDQVNAGMTTVSSHISGARDAYGMLKQTVDDATRSTTGWTDAQIASMHAAGLANSTIKVLTGDLDYMKNLLPQVDNSGTSAFQSMWSAVEDMRSGVEELTSDLWSANDAMNALGQSAGKSGGKGGRGGGLSGQLGFTGTPDQMRAEFTNAMAALDSASAWAMASGGFVEGIDAARQQLWKDLAASIANYNSTNPQSNSGPSSSSSRGSSGSSGGSTRLPAAPTAPQGSPTMVLYSDVTGMITSGLSSAVDANAISDALNTITDGTAGLNTSATALTDTLTSLQDATAGIAGSFQNADSTLLLSPDVPASWQAGADAIAAMQKTLQGALPGFQAAQRGLALSNPAMAEAAQGALAGFSRDPAGGAPGGGMYVPQPLLNPIANGVYPVPSLSNTMSQVTNSSSSNSSSLQIGQLTLGGSDVDAIAQQMITLLQRKGVRF